MKQFRRILFWSHLGVGVCAGFVILMLAFTGVLLTYERQMIASSEAGLVTLTDQSHLTADELAAIAREIGGDGANVRVPKSDQAPVKVLIGRDQTLIHPQSGEVLLTGKTQTAKTFEFITVMHRWFALKGDGQGVGKSITNIANLLFIFLAISGVYLWFTPIFRWAVLKTKMKLNLHPPTGKARDFNWHHVFSFWMYIPILVMSVTAAVISYSWANALVFAAFGEEPQSLRAPRAPVTPYVEAELPDGAANLEHRFQVASGVVSSWKTITFSGSTNLAEPTRFDVDFGNGAQPHLRRQVVISRSGAVAEKRDTFSQRSPGTQARVVIRFLHTGEVLGLVGQTLAGLGSLATLFLVWSGLALSYRRLIRPILRKRMIAN